MGYGSPDWETADTPSALRAAIAVLEQRERELLDATAETVERHGVRPDVPIATMPPAAQAELNPLTDRVHQVRGDLRDLRRRLAAIVPDEHGCYHLLDGSTARVASNGEPISAVGGVIYEEDGQTVDTSKRSDDWWRRHRRHLRVLSDRVRDERVARARCSSAAHASRVRPRARQHRCSVSRRSSSSSRTSGADPGSSDSDPASTADAAAGWWL